MSAIRPMVGLAVWPLILLLGCSASATDPSKPHHTADGFANPHQQVSHNFLDFLAWRWDRLRGHVPEGPQEPREYQFPVADNDPGYLRRNSGNSDTTLTWVGHATFLVQVDGLNILTDPHFTARASPVDWAGPERVVPPGLSLEELPPIDLVLISHNHYDSLDVETVRALAGQPGGPPRFFVPLGLKAWFAGLGIASVAEMDWWEQEAFRGLEVHAVPAQHFSSRTPFDRNETLWAGWVVVAGDFRLYFAGDSGYSPDFAEIGRRLGPVDLSLIPIGAYAPRWFMKPMHVNPEEAVRIHRDVDSRYSVGMHWGTFPLTDEPMDEPPQRLAAAREAAGIPAERFFVMRHGETRRLDPLLERPATAAE